MNYTYLNGFFMVIMFVMSALHIAYISQNDTYAIQKHTKVTAIWVYFLAAMLYILAVFSYHKYEDMQTYILHYLMGFVMLICLPATLISFSSMVITAGNV
jgi:hypothetical protein